MTEIAVSANYPWIYNAIDEELAKISTIYPIDDDIDNLRHQVYHYCEQDLEITGIVSKNLSRQRICAQIVRYLIEKNPKTIKPYKLLDALKIKHRWFIRVIRHRDHIKQALKLINSVKWKSEFGIFPETVKKAADLITKWGGQLGATSHIIATMAIYFSIDPSKRQALYFYKNLFGGAISTLYNQAKLVQTLIENPQPQPSKHIPFSKLTNVQIIDLTNYFALLMDEMALTYQNSRPRKSDLIREMTQVLTNFTRFFVSPEFLNQINTLCQSKNLSLLTMMDLRSYRRKCYTKERTDVFLKGMQLAVTEYNTLLPITPEEYQVETKIKKRREDEMGRSYNVYCDVDPLITSTLTELFTVCRYKPNNLRFIVLGSGDKDYESVFRLSKKLNILIIVISLNGDGLSKSLLELADAAYILYPKLVCVKLGNDTTPCQIILKE